VAWRHGDHDAVDELVDEVAVVFALQELFQSHARTVSMQLAHPYAVYRLGRRRLRLGADSHVLRLGDRSAVLGPPRNALVAGGADRVA
jgi:hypothetical protein